MAGITALQGLDRLELAPGETIMILGASGGVGHVALQLAKRLDLRVFAVASHKDGVALVVQLGADAAADGRRPFQKAARRFAPEGFAGALVCAGGRGWKDALELATAGPIARATSECLTTSTGPSSGQKGRRAGSLFGLASFTRRGDQ